MLKKAFSLLTLAVALTPALCFAQLKRDAKVDMATALTAPKLENLLGLAGLDPNKFSMSHSYSLSFSSYGGNSFNQGLYLNTMQYQLFDPLTVHLQLGVAHQPFGNQLQGGSFKNELFISSAGFEYKPNRNLTLQLEYSRQPASFFYHNSPFRDPISRNRVWYDQAEKDQPEQN